MRVIVVSVLLTIALCAQAEEVVFLKKPPQGCDAKGEVSVSSGSKLQGMLFSDAWINNNVNKKLRKAIRKAGGNRGVISDRREFLMESQFRGLEHIELDAWVWKCEEKGA